MEDDIPARLVTLAQLTQGCSCLLIISLRGCILQDKHEDLGIRLAQVDPRFFI